MLNRKKFRSQTKNNNLKGWAKYFHENTLKVAWSLILFLGGLVVLIYFAHIEFLPDIDLANATALLASAALIGAFIVFILGAFFVFPGLALREILSCKYLSDFTLPTKKASPCSASTSKGGFVDQLDLLHFALLAAVVAACFQISTLLLWPDGYLWLFVVMAILGAISFVQIDKINEIKSKPRKFFDNQDLVFTLLVCIWIIAGIFQILPFIIIFQDVSDSFIWIGLFFWLLILGFLNSLWGTNRESINWKLVAGAGGGAIFFMLMLASKGSLISESAMKVLGLGNVKNVTLVVNKDACSVIRSFAGVTACIGADNSGPFVSKNVTLLSRVGSEYLITACSNKTPIRIALKKADVIGWSAPYIKQNAQINKSSGTDCNNVTEVDARSRSVPLAQATTSTVIVNIDGKLISPEVTLNNGGLHLHLSEEFKNELRAAIKNELALGFSYKNGNTFNINNSKNNKTTNQSTKYTNIQHKRSLSNGGCGSEKCTHICCVEDVEKCSPSTSKIDMKDDKPDAVIDH